MKLLSTNRQTDWPTNQRTNMRNYRAAIAAKNYKVIIIFLYFLNAYYNNGFSISPVNHSTVYCFVICQKNGSWWRRLLKSADPPALSCFHKCYYFPFSLFIQDILSNLITEFMKFHINQFKFVLLFTQVVSSINLLTVSLLY